MEVSVLKVLAWNWKKPPYRQVKPQLSEGKNVDTFTTAKPNKEKSLDKYLEDANMTTNNEIKIQMSDEISIRNMLKQKEFDSGELYEHRTTTAQYSPLIETARTTKETPQNSKVTPTIKLAIDETKSEKEANMSKEERADEIKLVKPSNENEEEEELANEATEVT
uniref:Uncharacterized protein n=1 Tax=Heterorhabditis bacteriophora TaxID=37862 RepID=A0A1I7WRN0_HETBA